jgi:hypothetical protein
MSDNFLEPYQTLEELFKAEQSAFREKNPQKLAALAPQIQQTCKKVAELEQHFPELNPEQIRVVKVFIRRLQQHVGRSRTSWEQYQVQLEKQRNLLKSSKRFVHQAKLEQSNRTPHVSHLA